jgi:hypothetical protein
VESEIEEAVHEYSEASRKRAEGNPASKQVVRALSLKPLPEQHDHKE